MGVAAGAALLGIGLFLGNKFGIEGLRTFPTSKGTRPIVNGVVEAMEQAPGLGVAGGQKVVKVGWFIRRLPGGWHASPEAIEYASAVGVRLDENQTIVQPQIKTYGRTA